MPEQPIMPDRDVNDDTLELEAPTVQDDLESAPLEYVAPYVEEDSADSPARSSHARVSASPTIEAPLSQSPTLVLHGSSPQEEDPASDGPQNQCLDPILISAPSSVTSNHSKQSPEHAGHTDTEDDMVRASSSSFNHWTSKLKH